MVAAIEIKGLSKTYPRAKVEALREVSLTIPESVIFGLIGPNGAGKTSLIRSVLSLAHYRGSIKIFGEDARRPRARMHLSYLPERFNFYSFFRAGEVLQFFSRAKTGKKISKVDLKNLFMQVGLENVEKRRVKEMSKGQLQRLGVAGLLVGDPRLIIVDEPFNGIDPVALKDMRDLFARLQKEGKTILLSTHLLSELQKLCHTFAILAKGRLRKTLTSASGEFDLESVFLDSIKDSGEIL